MDALSPQLLEREDERSFLQGLVARAALGDGGVVVLEGQAGVGKTELLRTASELGQEAGMTVLRGRGSELDRAFAFGVVRQLLAREVMAAPDLLTGGAELAGPVLTPGPGASSADLMASLEALHWLVVNLAAREPLLLACDDVHWADRPSLRWLVFLAERIEDVPVLLVAATRPSEPGADQELLDALATAPATRALRPAPLSSAATVAFVRRHLPGAADAFATACHGATGGNPFLLGELLREMVAEGRTGSADEAPDVLEFGSERVGRAIRRRLRLQPPGALAVARAVAVLGPQAPLDQAAALAGVDEAEAAGAADALAAVNLLAAGRTLDFVHPVVRAAVYEQIAPHERHALHLAAAELLRERGAEQERVATHLLRLPPAADRGRIGVLLAAAREAGGRGATETAAMYLRRALEEDPPAEERAELLHKLGMAEAADLRPEFRGRFEEALRTTRDPQRRGRIALAYGGSLTSSGFFNESVRVFKDGFEGLEDRETPARHQARGRDDHHRLHRLRVAGARRGGHDATARRARGRRGPRSGDRRVPAVAGRHGPRARAGDDRPGRPCPRGDPAGRAEQRHGSSDRQQPHVQRRAVAGGSLLRRGDGHRAAARGADDPRVAERDALDRLPAPG
jgi:tetratricopeptide (TPR) repeat protein